MDSIKAPQINFFCAIFKHPHSQLRHVSTYYCLSFIRFQWAYYPSRFAYVCFRLYRRRSHRSTTDIRDARDAHIVLEAVRRNILPLIIRRLSANERDNLSSGSVFVWEEAEFKGGLERWTDGRRWLACELNATDLGIDLI